MAMITAMHHPQVISSQSPDARKIVWSVAARPDWFRAATAIATTPSPKAIRTKQPRNSERPSPQTVFRQAAPAPMRTYQTPFMPVASDGVSDTSTSLSRTSGLPEGPLERRADRRFSLNARLRVTAPSLERHGAAGGLTQEGVLCQVEQSGIQVTLRPTGCQLG